MHKTLLMSLAVIVAVAVVSCGPGKGKTGATPAAATATTGPSKPVPAALKKAEQRAAEHRRSAERRATEALKVLALHNPAKEKAVHEMIVDYVPTLMTWQDAHAGRIKDLWAQWHKARSEEKDQAKADGVMVHLDAVYATFRPQHEAFWTKLGTVLTAEQVEKVKNRYTADKTPVTYNAYLAIFPHLTDQQKAFALAQLKQAREEALDAASMSEKSDFYKKYKVKIEAQFEREGINTRKARQDFAAKQKAEAAAKKAATQAATQPTTQPAK
jgi:hypothetical protein